MKCKNIKINLIVIFLVFPFSHGNDTFDDISKLYVEAVKYLKQLLGIPEDQPIKYNAFPFEFSIVESLPERKDPTDFDGSYGSNGSYESVAQSNKQHKNFTFNPLYGRYTYQPYKKEGHVGNGQISSIIMGEGRGEDDEEVDVNPSESYHYSFGGRHRDSKKLKGFGYAPMMAARPISYPLPIPKIEDPKPYPKPYPTSKIDTLHQSGESWPLPIPKIPDNWTPIPWKTRRPCKPKDPCATKSRKPSGLPIPTVDWEWKPKPDYEASSEEKKIPEGKRRCTVKVNCDGEWKRLRGIPGIGTCYSNRCVNAKCSRADLTQCSLTLLGAKQIVDCYGHYCISSCVGELCIARCMGMYCEAKCQGHRCKTNCVGWNCATNENGIVLKHLRVGDQLGVYDRTKNLQDFDVYSRTRDDQDLEYVDAEFESDEFKLGAYNNTISKSPTPVSPLLDTGPSQRPTI